MKIKFIRALVATILCLVVFLTTTFIPSLRDYKWGEFLQGFSGGAGVGTLIATIHFYNLFKKEHKATGGV